MHSTNAKSKKSPAPVRRGATRFPGITGDADKLGVRRSTLFRVLTGEWKIPGLLARYDALKKTSTKH